MKLYYVGALSRLTDYPQSSPNIRCTTHGPFSLQRYTVLIIESVDSISRDGTDTPYM